MSASSLRVVPQRNGSPRLRNHESTSLVCELNRIRPSAFFSMNVNASSLPEALRVLKVFIKDKTTSAGKYISKPSAIQNVRLAGSNPLLINACPSRPPALKSTATKCTRSIPISEHARTL
jgi:hypothetical protein